MMFYRVNEHMVSCAIAEKEITQMGYHVNELYKDRELATQFMQEIFKKAKEVGFEISEHVSAVQVAVSKSNQLVLNFIEIDPIEQIESTIHNLLDAAETVDFVGKDRLLDILELEGAEKQEAFHNMMLEIKEEFYSEEEQENEDTSDAKTVEEEDGYLDTKEIFSDEPVVEEAEPQKSNYVEILPSEKAGKESVTSAHKIYFFRFQEMKKLGDFANKVTYEAPGKLYKEKEEYILLVDLAEATKEQVKSYLFMADEYASRYQKGTALLPYYEEHGETIIKENPISILKMI